MVVPFHVFWHGEWRPYLWRTVTKLLISLEARLTYFKFCPRWKLDGLEGHTRTYQYSSFEFFVELLLFVKEELPEKV